MGNSEVAKPGTSINPWLILPFKLGCTGLLLWVAMHKVPLNGIKLALFHVNLTIATASIGLFVVGSLVIESVRLIFAGRLLLEQQPRAIEWLRIFAGSRPFFYLAPGAMASEGMVWLRLRRLQWRHASCGFVVVITRVWGVAAWGCTAGFALSYPKGTVAVLAKLPPWVHVPAVWTVGAFLAALAAASAPVMMRRFGGLRVRSDIVATTLAMALASAFAVLVVGLSVWLAGVAAGTPLPFHSALGLMAIFNFAMIVPLSFGGFGLQEALVLLVGLSYGYPASGLVVFAMVIHLQRLALSLVGLTEFLAVRKMQPLGGRSNSIPETQATRLSTPVV